MSLCKKNNFCCKDNYVPFQKGKKKIIFIGEAPGYYETIYKKPFVGKSGILLRKLMVSAGIKDEEVFITNTVKCRPENNRTPTIEEIEECIENNLKEEIENLIKTEGYFIIGVGKIGSYAIEKIFDTKCITSKKNFLLNCFKLEKQEGKLNFLAFLPHPSYLLRTGSKELINKIEEFLKHVNSHKIQN